MRQLCKHFGHRVDTSYDDDSGYIQFEFGLRCELRATDGNLELTATAADEASGERVRNVVGSHLELLRQARATSTVSWSASEPWQPQR